MMLLGLRSRSVRGGGGEECESESDDPGPPLPDEGEATEMSEIEELRERLRIEVERRLAAQQEASEQALFAKSAREERDTALKMVRDGHAGVAKLLAQLQAQGAALEARRFVSPSFLPAMCPEPACVLSLHIGTSHRDAAGNQWTFTWTVSGESE